MKKKYLVLIGLLLALAVLLGGCATGLSASSWPGVTADADNAYIAGGPYVYAVNLQTGAEVWRFPAKAATSTPYYATPALTPDGQLIIPSATASSTVGAIFSRVVRSFIWSSQVLLYQAYNPVSKHAN